MSNNEILTMAIIPEVEFPFFVLSLSNIQVGEEELFYLCVAYKRSAYKLQNLKAYSVSVCSVQTATHSLKIETLLRLRLRMYCKRITNSCFEMFSVNVNAN